MGHVPRPGKAGPPPAPPGPSPIREKWEREARAGWPGKPPPTGWYSHCKVCREMHYQSVENRGCDPKRIPVFHMVGDDREPNLLQRILRLFVRPRSQLPTRIDRL